MKFLEIISEMSDFQKLSDEEKQIIHHLSEAYNLFVNLPNKHVSDDEEFARYIHILQRHVMSRLTRRSDPEMFGGHS